MDRQRRAFRNKSAPESPVFPIYGQFYQPFPHNKAYKFRFAAVFGYEIEPATASSVHKNRRMLGRVAAERVNTELCRLLTGQNAGNILRQYSDVLLVFWPEFGPLLTLEQRNPWHCWGGWEHTIRTVEAASADVTLRLTMLLHDIGKPSRKSTDEQGIDHFYGHPAVSAELADRMLKALKFDNATRKRVVELVEYHDAPLEPRDRVIRRWLNRLGPEAFAQLLEVKRADNLGQNPEKTADDLNKLEEIKTRMERIIAQRQCLTLKDLAVDGRDVMAAGVSPGPEVGHVLKDLLEEVLNGEIPNERAVLLNWITRQ